MSIAVRWQRHCSIALVLYLAGYQPAYGRDSLHLIEEGLLQQTEATTTLSLTHSVKYQQPADIQQQRSSKRLERQRNLHRDSSGASATSQSVESKDFDWELYLRLNPDLVDKGYTTKIKATQHYR